MTDTVKSYNICLIEISERRVNEAEAIFEEIFFRTD